MSSQLVFAFVQTLADDINSRKLSLPSFPDVALCIQKAIGNENCTINDLSLIIAREPKLTASILKLANSAQYSRGGQSLKDIPKAINRLGLSMVNTTAMTVAMSQLKAEKEYLDISTQLSQLWEHSILVASYAYVLARQQGKVNSDTALLAGMMHGIGKVYIWSRAHKNSELFNNHETLEDLVSSWHCPVGKSILETWCLPDEVISAVEHYQEFSEATDNKHILNVAVLSVANQLALANGDHEKIKKVKTLPEYYSLRLPANDSEELSEEIQTQVTSIHSALSM